MRVALYARVSTEDQAKEGFSLDAQMRKLEAYCRSRAWTPVGRYIDDGYSGRNTNRPAYREMMASMSEWDVVLVLKMDRIHRDSTNFTEMMAILKKNNKEFNSVQEKFDTTTAMGRFVMDILQRIAQLESEQIGERVKIGMKRKAESGAGPLGSGHPYGYVYNDRSLNIEPNEARTVRMIYRMRSDGLSMEEIAVKLNEDLIPAKKGGIWNKQSIHKILRNPLYIGKVKWDGIIRDGTHEAIIDPHEYEAADGGTNA